MPAAAKRRRTAPKVRVALALSVALIGSGLGLGHAWAAPGDLNNSFGGDGIADMTLTGSRLLGATTQTDGKLVAVGEVDASDGTPRLLVARFDPNGALDSTFDGDGVFLGPNAASAKGVAIQPDGKIVVAGALRNGTFPTAMLVMRLTSAGAPDTAFSGDGIDTTLAAQAGAGLGAVVQPDGKILVGGSARLANSGDGSSRPAVGRWNSNGTPDGSFGSGGTAVFDFGRLSLANAIGLDGSGRIVIAGQQQNAPGLPTAVLAARLNSNGTPDSSFAGNSSARGYTGVPGLFALELTRQAGFSAAFDLAIQTDGRIVLAGVATDGDPSSPAGSDALVARLNTNGTLDTSFDGDGVAYRPATANKDTFNKFEPFPGAYGIALGGSDILIGGFFDNFGLQELAVWALRPDGSSDPAFGSGGQVITSRGNSRAQLNDVTVGSSGILYGVGESPNTGNITGLAASYAGTGPPPSPPSPPNPPPPNPPPPNPPPPNPPPNLTCMGEAVTIAGTSGANTLRGTAGADVIAGLGSDDKIIGGGGADLVCAGAGDDQVFLQGGRDKASGGAGADVLSGADGADTLLGNAGADRLLGGAGPDELFGGAGPDELFGGAAADLLRGGRGTDELVGGPGDDDTRQ